MQMLISVLCFIGGVFITFMALLAWAWYLKMKDRAELAELKNESMEKTLKIYRDGQAVADELHNSLIAALKQKQSAAQPPIPINKNSSVSPSVKERLMKAVEITTKQNSIDTRRGHDFIALHNELELEKLALLKSILADGFDPLIVIRLDRGEQEMLLSDYVQSINKGLV